MELSRKWKFLVAAVFNALLFGIFAFLPNAEQFVSDEILVLLQGAVNSLIIGLVKDKD